MLSCCSFRRILIEAKSTSLAIIEFILGLKIETWGTRVFFSYSDVGHTPPSIPWEEPCLVCVIVEANGMNEEIFDVVLQSLGRFEATNCDWDQSPPPESNFFLNADLDFWIGSLPHNIPSKQIFDACDPAGFNFSPSRQFGCRYAFCRRVHPPSSERLSWDHDGVLHRVLFLSRLIHPTTIAPCYSARLFFENGKVRCIVPGHVQGYATHVWIVASEWRDWLSQSEAEQLKYTLPVYNQSPHERIRRARSHIGYAFHAYFLEQRTASLVSSFESLLKIRRNSVTAQFALRVPALAQRVGIAITEDEARSIYKDRSVFVHGHVPNYTGLSEDIMERYRKFETAIRLSLLKASTESEFADLFATDGVIESNFGSIPSNRAMTSARI